MRPITPEDEHIVDLCRSMIKADLNSYVFMSSYPLISVDNDNWVEEWLKHLCHINLMKTKIVQSIKTALEQYKENYSTIRKCIRHLGLFQLPNGYKKATQDLENLSKRENQPQPSVQYLKWEQPYIAFKFAQALSLLSHFISDFDKAKEKNKIHTNSRLHYLLKNLSEINLKFLYAGPSLEEITSALTRLVSIDKALAEQGALPTQSTIMIEPLMVTPNSFNEQQSSEVTEASSISEEESEFLPGLRSLPFFNEESVQIDQTYSP